MPTFTEYKNNSENLRGDLFRERVNSTRESLVAGVSGIQPTAEGEYVCTAENGSATASISVHIEIPGNVVSPFEIQLEKHTIVHVFLLCRPNARRYTSIIYHSILY